MRHSCYNSTLDLFRLKEVNQDGGKNTSAGTAGPQIRIFRISDQELPVWTCIGVKMRGIRVEMRPVLREIKIFKLDIFLLIVQIFQFTQLEVKRD